MKNRNKNLVHFLQNQKLLVLSTVDHERNPWICNVYYSVDNDLNLFFVSPPSTKHSQHIAANSQVAFSIVWYDQENLANRKAVQGVGKCMRVTQAKDSIRFLKNHYRYFPLWKNVITHENMRKSVIKSRPYIIKPSYIKFWNDELYGDEGTREFEF